MATEPLLTKDSINLFGHKFPIALVGGVAALAGVFLILRARQSGGSVASIGNAPAGGAIPAFGSSFAPDPSAALANISSQLSNLQGSLNGSNPPGMSAPAGPTTSDFDLSFGAGAHPTHLFERGSEVGATWVSDQLGAEWGGIVNAGENPTAVYGFLQDLFRTYGLGSAVPLSGFFDAYGPGGTLQRIPFWAPGSSPISPGTPPVSPTNPPRGIPGGGPSFDPITGRGIGG